jgi:hypothetical protein
MSKKPFALFGAGALSALLIISPALAQDTTTDPGVPNPNSPDVNTARTTDTADDDGMDLGWIGLLGLAGLAGLMKRDRQDHHVERATTVNR